MIVLGLKPVYISRDKLLIMPIYSWKFTDKSLRIKMSKQPKSTTLQYANAVTTSLEHELSAFIHADFPLSDIGMKNV